MAEEQEKWVFQQVRDPMHHPLNIAYPLGGNQDCAILHFNKEGEFATTSAEVAQFLREQASAFCTELEEVAVPPPTKPTVQMRPKGSGIPVVPKVGG